MGKFPYYSTWWLQPSPWLALSRAYLNHQTLLQVLCFNSLPPSSPPSRSLSLQWLTLLRYPHLHAMAPHQNVHNHYTTRSAYCVFNLFFLPLVFDGTLRLSCGHPPNILRHQILIPLFLQGWDFLLVNILQLPCCLNVREPPLLNRLFSLQVPGHGQPSCTASTTSFHKTLPSARCAKRFPMRSAATFYPGTTEMVAQNLPELRDQHSATSPLIRMSSKRAHPSVNPTCSSIALINATFRDLHPTFHVSGFLSKWLPSWSRRSNKPNQWEREGRKWHIC